LISGRAPFPPTTPYRALLLDAKIALVGVMIALALFNRFRLAPRLAPAAAALAALRATCAIEVALGTVVVALVGVFALLIRGEECFGSRLKLPALWPINEMSDSAPTAHFDGWARSLDCGAETGRASNVAP
jgi:Copper resistance protein D